MQHSAAYFPRGEFAIRIAFGAITLFNPGSRCANNIRPSWSSRTPDDVLAIIQEQHRQQGAIDPEADDSVQLTRATTIAQWRHANAAIVSFGDRWRRADGEIFGGWDDTRRVGRGLNQWWSLALSDARWDAVLYPKSRHTLGELCDLIAANAQLPRVRPATFFGAPCMSAGAFLRIRSCLASAGVSVLNVAPSTPLHQYTRRFPQVFFNEIARLAPGALPQVKVHAPVHTALMIVFLGGWLLSCLIGPCALVAIVALLALTIAGILRIPPARVQFGNLRTFADLAKLIAAAQSSPV